MSIFLELGNGNIYVGSTNDLKRRVASHVAGHVESTRRHLPAELKSYVAVRSEGHARELEIYFKSGSGKAIALKRLLRRTNKP
jgi:putative endonuclease